MRLIRRLVPQSIARQSQVQEEAQPPKRKHQFENAIIQGRNVRINSRKLPSDLPTTEDWFRIRVWSDEHAGRSLTL